MNGSSGGGSVHRYYDASVVFDGMITTKTITVSATIVDAHKAIWQLRNNADNYSEVVGAITIISNTQIVIASDPPLAAGNYTLIGIE